MTAFGWSAINPRGEVVHGVMDAPDQRGVVERLQRRGHVVLRAFPAEQSRRWKVLLHIEIGGKRGLDKATVGEFTRELAIMLAAGQDLDRALRFVVAGTRNRRARAILANVHERVRAGNSFAVALSEEAKSFSKIYVGLVRAGEAGGSLPETLDRLASLLERERNLSASLRASMIYPALLVVAAIGSVAFLLSYVLPQFVPIFEQAGARLPPMTRALMSIGTAVNAIAPWAVVAVVILGIGARYLFEIPAYRLLVDQCLLRVPITGGVLRETLAARLTRTLGTLLQNGVPMVAALGITRDALGNAAAAAAVDKVALAAKSGAGLAQPLADSGIFPERTTHLLRLGEEAAELPAMALKAADIHEDQVRLLTQRLVALAVPTITVAMGLTVALIVAALLIAMLSLNELAV